MRTSPTALGANPGWRGMPNFSSNGERTKATGSSSILCPFLESITVFFYATREKGARHVAWQAIGNKCRQFLPLTVKVYRIRPIIDEIGGYTMTQAQAQMPCSHAISRQHQP
jgi:hypothetical protein